ncbi:hypothetical protein CHU98_g7308 [Xylaria longipes]|nr:hypothetical protein CHU98_g7308 [Xylaria longipes]
MYFSKLALLVPFVMAAFAAPIADADQDAAKVYDRSPLVAQDAAKLYDLSTLAGQDAAKVYDRRDQGTAKFYDHPAVAEQDAAKLYDRRDQDAAKAYDRSTLAGQDAAKLDFQPMPFSWLNRCQLTARINPTCRPSGLRCRHRLTTPEAAYVNRSLSSFIADCTGREDAKIGHDLESCFDLKNTNKEDVEVLTAVAHYLSVSYANNVSVNGILYFHRISDTRIGSSTRHNLEMMRALCGEDSFENVAVVTTMWGSNHSEIELAKQRSREQELRDIYLCDMIEKGSQIVRHDRCNTLSERHTSAKNILTRTAEQWKDTQVTLQIQHEMVNLNMTLKETSAGRVLEVYIREHQSSYEVDLERLGISSKLPCHDSDESQLHASTLVLRDAHHSDKIQRMLTENNQALEALRLSLVHIKQEQ